MSYRQTIANAVGSYDGVNDSGETDPTGTGVGLDGLAYFQANLPPERDFPMYQPRGFDDVAVNQNGSGVACYEDGFVTSCARAYQRMEDGTAIPSVLGEARRPRQRPTLIPQRPRRPRPPDDGSRTENYWDPSPPVGVRLIFARLGLLASQQTRQQEQSQISDECNNALKAIKKNSDSVRRAKGSWDSLLKATGGDAFSASILAAMAIKESNFENVKEVGGGGGREVFQIDITKNPNLNFDPFDVEASTRWVLNTLDEVYNRAINAGSSTKMAVGAALHAYNGGAPGMVLRDKKGNEHMTKQLQNANLQENFGLLNAGTTDNYVTTILDVARECFWEAK